MVRLCFVTAYQMYNSLIQIISLPVSPYTVFYTKKSFLYSFTLLSFTLKSFLYSFLRRYRITFYLREDAGKFMCVYRKPECAVCVRVMFNNHYNNFLVYTSQI